MCSRHDLMTWKPQAASLSFAEPFACLPNRLQTGQATAALQVVMPLDCPHMPAAQVAFPFANNPVCALLQAAVQAYPCLCPAANLSAQGAGD